MCPGVQNLENSPWHVQIIELGMVSILMNIGNLDT